MYINATGYYIPTKRIYNDYFLNVNGLTNEWILQRTGIETRSKVDEGEDGVTMGIKAVENALKTIPYNIEDIDLIISAGYTPIDTVGSLAHKVQREFKIKNAKALMISSACSSLVNALEIVETYFLSNKASKALIICSEHNTYYSNEEDPQSGHLWGDAAVALLLSKSRYKDGEPEVLNITTQGLGHIGKGPDGVYLQPKDKGIVMQDGRDVFLNATKYMINSLNKVIEGQGITINDLSYIIAHQANKRIINSMLHLLEIPEERSLINIDKYGNTGSASAFLVMLENIDKFKSGDYIGITVFGGGYSAGAVLLRF
ncbi:MAG: ketoacyl-ACP synthase III [Bacteroidales bacterium]|jgi:3-oxoacyl-[acyl-carrier-protein] synthase-3|nr:ketoacyl-ACP synthase III [Bacteroidales bacterium]